MYKHVRKETPYEAYLPTHTVTSNKSRKLKKRENALNIMKKS